MAITYVCKYWRDITLGLPRLWSLNIVHRNHIARIERSLERSKQAPLTVRHGLFSKCLMPAGVFDEMHRMRDLQVLLQDTESWLRLKDSLANAPLLEALDATVALDVARTTRRFDYTAVTPKLRKLSLSQGSSAMFQALLCPTLVKLHVKMLMPRSVPFIDVLRRLPLLEELELSEAFIPAVDITVLVEPVPLIRMRALSFSESKGWKAPASLLASLTLPSTVRIHFKAEASDGYFDDYEPLYRAIASTFADDPLAPPQHIAACYAQGGLRMLKLQLWTKKIAMRQMGATNPKRALTKAEPSQLTIEWCGWHTGQALHALFCYFPLPKLSRLRLNDVPTYDDTWWTLAQAQNLREIKIEPHEIAVELITALQSSPPEDTAAPNGHPPPSARLFPKLEALTLRSIKWDTRTRSAGDRPLVAEVRVMLQSRRNHGIPLKRLFLENGIDTQKTDMEYLRRSEEGLEAFSWS